MTVFLGFLLIIIALLPCGRNSKNNHCSLFASETGVLVTSSGHERTVDMKVFLAKDEAIGHRCHDYQKSVRVCDCVVKMGLVALCGISASSDSRTKFPWQTGPCHISHVSCFFGSQGEKSGAKIKWPNIHNAFKHVHF